MGVGHSGQIKSAKHKIELISLDKRSIHSASYHAGLREQDFKKLEIDKLLARDVVEPAEMVGNCQSCLHLRMAELSNFSWTIASLMR